MLNAVEASRDSKGHRESVLMSKMGIEVRTSLAVISINMLPGNPTARLGGIWVCVWASVLPAVCLLWAAERSRRQTVGRPGRLRGPPGRHW